MARRTTPPTDAPTMIHLLFPRPWELLGEESERPALERALTACVIFSACVVVAVPEAATLFESSMPAAPRRERA